MNPRKAVCFLAVLLFASVPLALAQGTYTQIDVPGSTVTRCLGINNMGDIVGWFVNGTTQGFLFRGGAYTSITYKGQTTSLTGINDLNQVVGNTSHTGFVYNLETQVFTQITPKHHDTSTPTSINNSGVIAGSFYTYMNPKGFELIGSTYFEIIPPTATATYVNGVSGSGELVGFAWDRPTGKYFSFSYVDGAYHKLVIPNAPQAFVYGINPAGDTLVGSYISPLGTLVGFVYQNNSLTSLQFPGTNWTVPIAVSGAGEVVGYFVDMSNNVHGFTWTPPADAAKKSSTSR